MNGKVPEIIANCLFVIQLFTVNAEKKTTQDWRWNTEKPSATLDP